MNKSPDFKKLIFIPSFNRTGSTLLVNQLSCGPHICIRGEPPVSIKSSTQDESRKNFEEHYCRVNENVQIGGCKFFHNVLQIANITNEYIMSLNDNVKIIRLWRENLLDVYISFTLAINNNTWIAHNGESAGYKKDTFYLDIQKFNEFANMLTSIKQDYDRIFPNSCFIEYNQIATNPQKIFDEKIFDYLEIERFKIKQSIYKQNIKLPEQIITNFDDVKSELGKYL